MKKKYITLKFIYAVIMIVFFVWPVQAQINWHKAGTDTSKYEMREDNSIQYGTEKVLTIQSIAPKIDGFGTFMQNAKPAGYLGKRIRMTGFMKSEEVAGWAGFWLRVDQAGLDHYLSFDNMRNRAVKGTTAWHTYSIVLDVPSSASNLAFGALLFGRGQVWFSNIHFEVVDNLVPVTGLPYASE